MACCDFHRVLIVDDDLDIQEALSQLFEAHGFEIGVARTGAEAIQLLEDGSRPCTLIVDLLMPGIVGQELLEYVQTEQDLAGIPVAIISGSPELAPEGYEVFPKPIDAVALLDFVRSRCPLPASGSVK